MQCVIVFPDNAEFARTARCVSRIIIFELQVHEHIVIYRHTYRCIHVCKKIHIYTHTYIHTYTRTCIYIYMFSTLLDSHVRLCIYEYIYKYIHMGWLRSVGSIK